MLYFYLNLQFLEVKVSTVELFLRLPLFLRLERAEPKQGEP